MVRKIRFLLVPAAVLLAGALAAPAGAASTDNPHTAPVQGLQRVSPHHSTSSNWSGYAVTGATFQAASGSWTQPAVTCPTTKSQYASFWVGIDGDNSSTVEQIGTDSDCISGKPTYYAWYEMYPAAPVNLTAHQMPVSPGGTFTATVQYANGAFTLSLTNGTTTFTTTPLAGTPARSSAEWIAEAPSVGGHVLPLANFGSVSFSGASATDSNENSGTISDTAWNDDAITLVQKGLTATPGTLASKGSAFTVVVSTSGGGSGGGHGGHGNPHGSW